MELDRLHVNLAGIQLANPTMLASGALGYSSQMLRRISGSGAGAVVTKSVGAKAREGYPNPTVVQGNCGLINAVGLPNPGIEAFVAEIRETKASLVVPVIVSVYGFSTKEYVTVAQKAVKAGADAIELNVSCPHVKETGSEIGQNPQILSEVVAGVKKIVHKPVFVKLSPNVTSVTEVAEAAVKAGADGLTLVNTVKAMAIDVEMALPVLANRVGGLSGEAVKPIAVRAVYDVYEHVKVPIIGCGGIGDWKDAVEFLLAGACAVQIGTAIATKGLKVFSSVTNGIGAYLRKRNLKSVNDIVGLSHCC